MKNTEDKSRKQDLEKGNDIKDGFGIADMAESNLNLFVTSDRSELIKDRLNHNENTYYETEIEFLNEKLMENSEILLTTKEEYCKLQKMYDELKNQSENFKIIIDSQVENTQTQHKNEMAQLNRKIDDLEFLNKNYQLELNRQNIQLKEKDMRILELEQKYKIRNERFECEIKELRENFDILERDYKDKLGEYESKINRVTAENEDLVKFLAHRPKPLSKTLDLNRSDLTSSFVSDISEITRESKGQNFLVDKSFELNQEMLEERVRSLEIQLN